MTAFNNNSNESENAKAAAIFKLFLLHLDFGDKCHRKKLNLTVSLSLNYQLAFIYSNFDYQAN